MAPTFSPQQLSDRLEIHDLLVRYAKAIDDRDFELLDTCFLPDADVDYTSSGGIQGKYREVRAWLEKALAPFTAMMHLIGNSTIELQGDRARGRTYVYNPMGLPKQDGSLHFFSVGAHYVDELVRTREGWRIAKRVEETRFFEGSLPEGFQVPR
jgi:3-phenylpropionate/cinnamic acid dioxygenase small subunit